MSTVESPPTHAAASEPVRGTPAWDRISMNRTGQLLCIVAAPVLTLIFVIGGIFIGELFPPRIGAKADAQTVANWFAENKDQVRIGAVCQMFAFALMPIWAIAIAAQTRRREGAFPVWSWAQILCAAAGTGMIVMVQAIFAAAAYRPLDVDPQITQTLFDVAWFTFLGTWGPFTLWCLVVGGSILLDKAPEGPVFPRWSGYLSIWTGILFVPGGAIWFFKSGAFGWQGVIALWIPFVIFFAWICTMSWLSYQNITRRGWVHQQDVGSA